MDLVVVDSDDLDATVRRTLRTLWDRAFGDRFSDEDADHAYGGVHVLAHDGDQLIGHAAAVDRRMKFGAQPWRSVGYVEAVSVSPERQGEGIGRSIMQTLHAEISARWPIALLSTGRATPFYESLGWEQWQGPTLTRTAAGAVVDSNHGGLMVRRIDPSVQPDLSTPVTCEDRPGNAW